MTGTRPKARISVITGVLLIAVIAAEGLVLRYTWDSPSESAEREVMRASIQVLFVVLVGAIVTFAVGNFQRSADDRRKRADDANAEARRVDERTTDFAAQMLDAYNGVKRIRRLLEAEAGSAGSHNRLHDADRSQNPFAIHRAAYVEHMSHLCDRQLEFESLKKRARVLQPRIAGADAINVKEQTRRAHRTGRLESLDIKGSGAWTTTQTSWEEKQLSLEEVCGSLESHLNQLVKEFQENLRSIPLDGTVRLIDLKPPPGQAAISATQDGSGPMLPVFIYDTDCFRALVTRYVDAARDCLDNRLLRRAGESG